MDILDFIIWTVGYALSALAVHKNYLSVAWWERLSNNLIGCPEFGCAFSHTNVKIARRFLAYRHFHTSWSG